MLHRQSQAPRPPLVPEFPAAADRLERQSLESPRPERVMVVGCPFGMDEDARAEPADMLVEGRLEPDIAQNAAFEPVRGQRPHLGRERGPLRRSAGAKLVARMREPLGRRERVEAADDAPDRGAGGRTRGSQRGEGRPVDPLDEVQAGLRLADEPRTDARAAPGAHDRDLAGAHGRDGALQHESLAGVVPDPGDED